MKIPFSIFHFPFSIFHFSLFIFTIFFSLLIYYLCSRNGRVFEPTRIWLVNKMNGAVGVPLRRPSTRIPRTAAQTRGHRRGNSVSHLTSTPLRSYRCCQVIMVGLQGGLEPGLTAGDCPQSALSAQSNAAVCPDLSPNNSISPSGSPGERKVPTAVHHRLQEPAIRRTTGPRHPL